MAPPPQTATPAEHPAASAAAGGTESSLAETLLVLRKRKWVLIAVAVFGLALGIYRAFTQPRIYTASGKIEVRSGSANQYRVDAGGGGGIEMGQTLETEVAILQSDSLLASVAREMDLANNPSYGRGTPAHRLDINQPEIRYIIVKQLHGAIKVSLVLHTDLIEIRCTDSSPQQAADIVNHLINAYIQRSYETRFASTQRVSQWLSGQLDDLKRQVETSQEQLIDLQKKLGVLGLGFDATHTTTQSSDALDSLSHAVSEARITRILAESRFRILSTVDPNSLESVMPNVPGAQAGELDRLRGDLAGVKADLAQQSEIYGPNHPKTRGLQDRVRELSLEISTEQNRLISQARQTLNSARVNEDQTTKALEDEKNQAYKLRDNLVEYTLRQREYESNRTLYEGLLSRLRAAGVQAGLESMEIDIVDPAVSPIVPTMLPRSTVILTTLVFCMLGGIVLCFLLESLDTGLRSVAEIEALTGLPTLGVIPRIRRAGPEPANASVAVTNLGVLATSNSQFAEAFRALRTAFLLSSAGHPPKILQFTSATPADGKTTIASNLACILAQRETRVLLIDSDLRRPSIHHRFGLPAKIGLTTLLAGATTFEQSIQQIPEVPNLDILVSGPVPPFPTEMLSSEAMRQLIERCAGIYTHIVLDSPPVLSVTDGVILARQADAVALVIRHGKSSRNVVRRARDLLARSGAPITGVILNDVDLNSPEYYGYYGYSGYAYANLDADAWRVDQANKTAQGHTDEEDHA